MLGFSPEVSIGEWDKHVCFWCINIKQLELLRATTCMKPIWWSDSFRHHFPFPDSGTESGWGRTLVVPPAASLCQDSNLLGTLSILNSLSNHFSCTCDIHVCVHDHMCSYMYMSINIFGIHVLRPRIWYHKLASPSVLPCLWPKPLGQFCLLHFWAGNANLWAKSSFF